MVTEYLKKKLKNEIIIIRTLWSEIYFYPFHSIPALRGNTTPTINNWAQQHEL